eukprot:5478926-Pleurochrysis_carterae.AAC.1
MSLPAVRLFWAGLPPEPTMTPQAVACFQEAYAQATHDVVLASTDNVTAYVYTRHDRILKGSAKEKSREQALLRLRRQAVLEAEHEAEERRKRGGHRRLSSAKR